MKPTRLHLSRAANLSEYVGPLQSALTSSAHLAANVQFEPQFHLIDATDALQAGHAASLELRAYLSGNWMLGLLDFAKTELLEVRICLALVFSNHLVSMCGAGHDVGHGVLRLKRGA